MPLPELYVVTGKNNAGSLVDLFMSFFKYGWCFVLNELNYCNIFMKACAP